MANTQLSTQQQTGLTGYLSSDAVKNNIAEVIGEKNTTRFISSVVSAVQANPTLAQCSNGSILSAALQGEALQLAPSPQLGQFYMVPYDNKKKVGNSWQTVKEAQFQIGYKGYLQLAIRSGQYKKIVVNEIKEGEIDYNPITEEIHLHPITDPAQRVEAETIGYYAMFELMNGFKKELFSPKEAIRAHAEKYSSAYRYDLKAGKKGSKWTTDFDAMAKKTLIRQLIGKWGIMSVEMQQAYEKDMAIIDEDGNSVYADNQQDIEYAVAEDISQNANSEVFEEDMDVVDIEETSKPKATTKATTKGTARASTEKSSGDEDVPEFMR